MATFDQHAYYRIAVLPIWADYCGYSNPGEMHYWLKVIHISPELWLDGEPPSCAVLDVEQFSDFLERVIRHGVEERLSFPPPRGEA